MVKFFSIFLALWLSFALLLGAFELTLYLFHSPFGSTIIEPEVHAKTWEYLLRQEYIAFIDLDIFTIHEKRHLLDVKRLFESIYSIWVISLVSTLFVVAFLYFRAREMVELVRRYIFWIGAVVIIGSFLVVAIGFLDSFGWLHQLLFPANSWYFAEGSILIVWFPIVYFQEFVVVLMAFYLVVVVYLSVGCVSQRTDK